MIQDMDTRVGDLWLVSRIGGPWYARFMRWCITFLKCGLHTKYSHVAMAIGEVDGVPRLISAERDGVCIVPASRYIDGPYRILVARHLDLTKSQIDKLYNKALEKRFKKYSYATLVAHLFGWRFANWVAKRIASNKVCSEVVGEIYYEAIGYRPCKRHTGKQLPPGGQRPRDWAWSVRFSPWADVFRRE